MYDVTRGLRKNGSFLLNTIWEGEELAKNLPNKVKKYFAQNNISVYYINATQIALEIGLGNRTNTILQSAFFRITGVIPVDQAVEQMKKFIVKSYGKKGEDVVNKNYAAVDRGGEYKTLTVDPAWANLPDDAKAENNDPAFINEVVRPINAQDGDLLPVSAFKGLLMPRARNHPLRSANADSLRTCRHFTHQHHRKPVLPLLHGNMRHTRHSAEIPQEILGRRMSDK